MKIEKMFLLSVKPGDCVLDIGAHEGNTARLFSEWVGKNGAIYAFECHPEKFMKLSCLASAVGAGNLKPYCKAVSDTIGHAHLYFGSKPEADQASTICPDLAVPSRLGDDIGDCTVETETVDHFCEGNRLSPNFIKIDTEGSEPRVFAGAEKTISRCLCPLVFEFTVPSSPTGTGIPDHFGFLRRLGYQLFVVDILYRAADAIDGSVPELSDKVIAFTDDDLLRAQPLCGNIVALPANHPLLNPDVLPRISWEDALPFLVPVSPFKTRPVNETRPVKSIRQVAKLLLPPVVLRGKRWLYEKCSRSPHGPKGAGGG